MAKPSKTAKGRPAGRKPNQKVKVNKTAWVQSLPASMPAKEVVAKAKSEGFTISPAQVYTARSKAKSKGPSPATRRAAAPAVPAKGTSKATSNSSEFRRLVLMIGIAQAEAELASLKQSVGL